METVAAQVDLNPTESARARALEIIENTHTVVRAMDLCVGRIAEEQSEEVIRLMQGARDSLRSALRVIDAAKKIPAYLSADGGDARLVASYEGREVWAVRRKHGHDRRTADVRAGDPGPHFYWTPVIQTEPGREKCMALYIAGQQLRFDDCDTCVRAITDRLANRDSLEEFLRSNMETR